MSSTEAIEYTAKKVAAHNTKDDCWMIIQGQVYNVTKYIYDHPGGADILVEAAGKDATVDFDNAGHSEDAFEIMAEYHIGKFKGAPKRNVPKPVTLKAATVVPPAVANNGFLSKAVKTTSVLSISALAVHQAYRFARHHHGLVHLPKFSLSLVKPGNGGEGMGFLQGFFLASAFFTVASGVAVSKLSKLLHMDEGGFMSYPPHVKMPKRVKPNLLLQRGWLDSTAFHALPLTEKDLLAPNVYRLVFALPTPDTVLGLPIGQHVYIKAEIDGKTVQRSYTPVSNNSDRGVIELVIRCYPDGQLTGKHLSKLEMGDEVMFRGPKGAMRYQHGLCKKIGMLAGGTGITPMYQLIRAICEDYRDLTEVSLIYANRSEGDILLRKELESFARRYPQNLKIHYLLDAPPEKWTYGIGYVTQELMEEKFPAPGPDSKVMLCGPPGMVNAAKKSLVNLGFEKPGASSKMTDQVFCF